MEKKIIDISHVVFMELIRTVISNVGVAAAKGSLVRIAIQAADQVETVDFPSYKDFVSAIENLENPISCLEGKAEYLQNGLFGLPQCPFADLLGNYSSFYGECPKGFEKLSDEFNKQSNITKKLHVGSGAAVGPFCVFHQPMRSQAAAKITIGGQKIDIYQLGCKTSAGKKALADNLIEEFGNNSRDEVDKVLDKYMCCYGVKISEN